MASSPAAASISTMATSQPSNPRNRGRTRCSRVVLSIVVAMARLSRPRRSALASGALAEGHDGLVAQRAQQPQHLVVHRQGAGALLVGVNQRKWPPLDLQGQQQKSGRIEPFAVPGRKALLHARLSG